MRCRLSHRRDRGGLMLGFSAFIAVLAVLCASAMLRSLETYHTSALEAQRIQARAAAEGGAIAWSRHTLKSGKALQLGECVVTSTDAANTSECKLLVAVHPKQSKRASLQLTYLARADVNSSGSATLRGLELIP